MEHDFRAARDAPGVVFAGGRDFKSAAARRRPGPDFVRAGAAAGDDDALGDHERGVKSDAELADQAGAVLGLGQARQKGLGAGTRDGAEIVDQLLPVHADAAVDDAERIGFLVRHDADSGRVAVADQIGGRDRLVAQLVAGVRRVRDQFAQENVGLRIDRMHHQVQQFGDLGLEWLGFGCGISMGGHNRSRFAVGCKVAEKSDIATPSGEASAARAPGRVSAVVT